VAVQQGRFLAKVFNKIQPEEDDDDKKDDDKKSDKDEKKDDKKADKDDKKDDKDDDDDDDDEDKPVFRYKHVGGYEYVGAEDGFVERGSRGTAIVTGPGAVWLWRSVYFRFVWSFYISLHFANPAFEHRVANSWTSESDPKSGTTTSIIDCLATLLLACNTPSPSPVLLKM
jgi:NADH dehydrogenase FAD-containing subunit